MTMTRDEMVVFSRQLREEYDYKGENKSGLVVVSESEIVKALDIIDQLQSELDALKAQSETLQKQVNAEEFWTKIIWPDGADPTDIQNELTDYHFMLEQVPKVYTHITGGLLSKPNYYAETVIDAADDYQERLTTEETSA